MDLLASLNIDELPEQQTRMMEIMERHPDLDVKLGFDACCTCGAELGNDKASRFACPQCERVEYCSEACRQQDAQVLASTTAGTSAKSPGDNGEEPAPEETAMGHSSIICALLKLCQDDEDVENKDPTVATFDHHRHEAAQDRIQSELESYPATLANVIAEGPCYQDKVLNKISQSSTKKLTIHVIGASVEAELWNNQTDLDLASKAYAEAFADLAEKRGLSLIEVIMIGPDCPSPKNLEKSRPITKMDQSDVGQLTIRTYKGAYNSQLLKDNSIPKADIVVFFNPGFTVPDYQWTETLGCIPQGMPFLSTTNTEMEGIADCQFLLDQDKIESIPPGLAEMFGLYSHADDEDDYGMALRETSFFTVNPFCGSRVRQSGTMGNDLFVKNRWMLGGVLGTFDQSSTQQHAGSEATKKRRTANDGESSGNSKASNPALI